VTYDKVYSPERAARYSQAKQESQARHRRECSLLERAVRDVQRPATLLDLPCGDGRMSVHLARLGFEVTAADVSPAMVELARQRVQREGLSISVAEEDLEHSSYRDQQFDLVVCFRLFHHFQAADLRQRMAEQICRLASRTVVVSYLDRRSIASRRRRLVAALGRPLRRAFLDPTEVAASFASLGFTPRADLAEMAFWRSHRVLVADRAQDQGAEPS
jgi:2-polyprenyl-3-methyl-5-hydroxy-6-metoxy-1,4-benzoquinol methylase